MSILRRITDKFGAMRHRSKDKKEFMDSILSAAEDGKLSDSEITELQTRLKELELTDEDIRIVRVQGTTLRCTQPSATGESLPKRRRNWRNFRSSYTYLTRLLQTQRRSFCGYGS
jgi:hypothetical protein